VSEPLDKWAQARRVFRLPFSRARAAAEVDEELGFHLEERIEQFMAGGMTREEAVAEAQRRFGDYDAYRKQARTIHEVTMRRRGRFELFGALRREVIHSARVLLRTPAFSLIAFVTLALGIGATTAIYVILDAVVLRPLAYPEADRLVSVLHPATVPGNGESKWGLSAAGYFHIKAHNRTLADLGSYRTGTVTVSGEGAAEVVRSGLVTASLLSTLRARAAVGRLILPDDDRPGSGPVVLLGYDFWQRRFGGDRAVVGRQILTNEGSYQIIGVAERGLTLPKPGPFASTANLAGFGVDLWFPMGLDPAARPMNSHQYSGIGRLKPGVTVADAQKDLQGLTNQFVTLFPQAYSDGFMKQYNFRMGVIPLRDEVLGPTLAGTLWILFGAVGLVLLIACFNVANLFLVRMEARRRESAIRAALGADRFQMAALYLSESLLLTLAAGAAGVVVARLSLAAFLASAPTDIPRLSSIGMPWGAVAFAAVVSLLAGVAFGTMSVARSGVDATTLREGGRGLTASKRPMRIRSGLVVGQVAMALMLLAAAGLMLRSFAHLRAVRPGLDPRGVLTVEVALPFPEIPTMDAAAAFHHQVQEQLAALPGVTAVGAVTGLPLQDYGSGCTVVFREGRPYTESEQTPCVSTPLATPGFFQAMGIQVTGRAPDWSDVDGHTGAVVVTKALADRLWPGEDPIGKGINSNGPGTESRFYHVVGVIPELRAHGLDQRPTEAVFYAPVRFVAGFRSDDIHGVDYVIRTSNPDPMSLVPALRRIVSALNPNVPLINPQTMQSVVDRSMARRSFLMTLLGLAGGMALLLSAVGIYGVISYLVTQRRSEIGVRMALGARVSQISSLVVLQSLRLVVLGVAIGLLGALAGTRALRSLLFEVSPTDPIVLAVVSVVLLAIAAVASLGPARRAARVDPVEVLRGE
jgi:predicted permease